jgi:hypothetical protein
MALTGKGFMIWKVERCESGNADAIADAARQAGLTHVVIKIAQGVLPANIDKLSRVDRVPPIVQALRKNGIQVLGWHNIFGHDPIREAHLAVQRTQQLELDGYVFDAGYEYKSPGMASAAHAFMTELRKGILNKPVGLSSYRSPKYHHTLPWKEFLEKCDFTMPQVYWEMAHNPADQLTKCVLQFQELPVQRPIIPTGPVYRGRNNWSASPGEITEFLIQARALGIKAVNFFEWHYGRTLLKPIWNAIAAFPWPPYPTPPAVKDVPQQYIEILNTRDPDLLSYMYTRDAVHITTSKC